MTSIGRGMLLAAVLCAAATVESGVAAGATYTVLSCKDRAGAPAPASDTAGGWTPGSSAQPGVAWADDCATSAGGLEATVSGPWAEPVFSKVWWRFVPPAGTSIQDVSILYSGFARPVSGQNRGIVYVWGPHVVNLAEHYGVGVIAARWLTRQGLHEPWIQAVAECDGAVGASDCPAGLLHASVTILRSEMVLADSTPPDAGAVGGSATASGTWRGTQTFAFPATDVGSGVYQMQLDVDGSPAITRTIEDWGGRCVDTTAGGRVFRYPQPCLTSVDALVPVNADELPAGAHDVTLRISDAAGNLRTVYSARKTIVPSARRIGPDSDPAMRGAANGQNATDAAKLAARWTRTRRSTLIGPYGRRQVIRGRLTNAVGAGIRNARIELLTEIDHRDGGALDKGGARTRNDGRFTLILPRNASSRTLLLRYRSHVYDTVSAAERSLRLEVRAGVRLEARPHITSQGHTITLRGRLVGRPLPHSGKVVELQARGAHEPWITFRTVRASRSGRFATRYTFRRGGPALYLMRARVRAADDYPFATGASHSVRIRVR